MKLTVQVAMHVSVWMNLSGDFSVFH